MELFPDLETDSQSEWPQQISQEDGIHDVTCGSSYPVIPITGLGTPVDPIVNCPSYNNNNDTVVYIVSFVSTELCIYSVSTPYIYLHVYTAYAGEQAAARNLRILPAIQHAQHRHSLMLCSVSVDKKFLLHALPALLLGTCVVQLVIGLV